MKNGEALIGNISKKGAKRGDRGRKNSRFGPDGSPKPQKGGEYT